MLYLSNPCIEPKGSQLNQTQGHKTKSLGHYITIITPRKIENTINKNRALSEAGIYEIAYEQM